MSDRTAGAAVDAMVAINDDAEDFGWEMFALLEAVDFEYERWCRILDLDPDSNAVFEKWSDLNWRYADTWKELGTDEFVQRIGVKTIKWRGLLGARGAA